MREIQPEPPLTGDPRLEGFLDHLARQDLADSTVRAYRTDLQGFFRWYHHQRGEQARLEKIDTIDLVRYRDHLIEGRKARPATINRRVESLRKLCRWAHREGVLKKDVTKDIKPVRRAKRTRPLDLRDDEIQGLLRMAGTSSHGLSARNLALVHLFFQAGLRVGEVAELRLGDLTLWERSGAVRVRGGKGRKERVIPLNKAVRRALRLYLKPRLEQPKSPPDPEQHVFLSTREEGMSIRAIQHLVAELARRAGIERLPVSAHTLRHTFALRYLRRNSGKLVELAQLLGHESLETTAIYTRPSFEDLAQGIERISLDDLG